MQLPAIMPMRLSRRRDPFNDADWLFELKHDGFRALAYVYSDRCEFVSRNGNVFKQFGVLAGEIHTGLRNKPAILDGELVCLDSKGRSLFKDLLFHRMEPRFFAFDLPWCNGRDLRHLPLTERKQRLRKLIPDGSARLLYCDHVEENGRGLFELACQHDLEGIVAKWKHGRYTSLDADSTWVKIRNRNYSQMMGRDELFDRRLSCRSETASDGWAGCVLACHMADVFYDPAEISRKRNFPPMSVALRLVIPLT
jgi:bifunctional non-homologous end joining protein LigD